MFTRETAKQRGVLQREPERLWKKALAVAQKKGRERHQEARLKLTTILIENCSMRCTTASAAHTAREGEPVSGFKCISVKFATRLATRLADLARSGRKSATLI
jgi:hypothetical protein